MPRMDGTGPTGQGAGTGRGMGPCGKSGGSPQRPVPGQQTGWLGTVIGILGALGVGGTRQGTGRGQGQGRGRSR